MPAASRFRRRFSSLASALVSGLDLRLLLLWVLGTLSPALIAALPIWRALSSALDLSPLSPDVARSFDALVFEDLSSKFREVRATQEGAVLVAVACFVFISPLLTAAMLATAESGRKAGFLPLLQGALAWYGRTFRFWLVTLIPVGALFVASGWFAKKASSYAERAVLESRASSAEHLALAATVLLAALLHVSVEAGRAELVANPQRRSVLLAWLMGVRKALAQPLETLALYLAPSALSLCLAAAFLAVRLRLSNVTWVGFVCGAVITQLGVAAIGWGHLSRLIALSRLFRGEVASK